MNSAVNDIRHALNGIHDLNLGRDVKITLLMKIINESRIQNLENIHPAALVSVQSKGYNKIDKFQIHPGAIHCRDIEWIDVNELVYWKNRLLYSQLKQHHI